MKYNTDNLKSRAEQHRDYAIDFLRVIGTLCIILAHTNIRDTSNLAADIRMFDVVMLVFISGLTACRSVERIHGFKDYLLYIWKRIKRLLFPAWIFLTGYFIFAVVVNFLIPNTEFGLMNLARSYTLFDGIGYVWIIRIYLCMAVIAPVLYKITRNISKSYILAIVYAAAVLVNSLLVYTVGNLNDSAVKTIIVTAILPILGYGIIYMIAMKYRSLNRSGNAILILVTLVMLIGGCVISGGFHVQAHKYPPNIIYITYGLLVSMLLYAVLGNLRQTCAEHEDNIILKLSIWISQHSLDIYFAHILVKFFFKYLWEDAPFYIEYAILVLGAVVLTLVKSYFKGKIERKMKNTRWR